MSELSKNGLGAEIKLTKDTKYICPSDGYFEIDCAYDTNSYALGYVEGKRVMSVASNNSGAVLATFPFSSIFVKRGMEILFDGTSNANGYFYPFE